MNEMMKFCSLIILNGLVWQWRAERGSGTCPQELPLCSCGVEGVNGILRVDQRRFGVVTTEKMQFRGIFTAISGFSPCPMAEYWALFPLTCVGTGLKPELPSAAS